MPIDAKEFDKHQNPLKYIVEFLKNHGDKAFTALEIAKETGLNESEISSNCFYDLLAALLDRSYRRQIESVTVGGIVYYKYRS